MKDSIIKSVTEGYSKSIKDMWNDYTSYISGIKEKCINTPSYVKKKKNGNSIVIEQSKNSNTKLCKLIEDTKKWSIWISEISIELANIPIHSVGMLCRITGESLEYALGVINEGVDYATNWLVNKMSDLTVNNIWFKKMVKLLKKIILYIKKSIKQGELFIYKTTKKVLNFAANNKVTDALVGSYTAVFNFIEKISMYIDIALKTIEGLLNTLVGFNLEGETMGFFITPKTIMAGFTVPNPYTTMSPKNIDKTIKTNIPDEVIEGVKDKHNAEKLEKETNNNNKILAKIKENIEKTINGDDTNIPDIEIEQPEEDLSSLITAISVVVATIFQPEPLPKYERLSITNIGYMAWLLTSFEPTMKKCFGLPTFP